MKVERKDGMISVKGCKTSWNEKEIKKGIERTKIETGQEDKKINSIFSQYNLSINVFCLSQI